jgi:hypothetical protein
LPELDDGAVAPAGSKQRLLAALVSLIVLTDVLGCWLSGFHVTGTAKPAIEIASLWLLTTLYLRFRSNPRLTEMLSYVVLWLIFSSAAAVLTYLAAAFDLPLRDGAFQAVDRALHVDVVAWSAVLAAHPVIDGFLKIDYFSVVIQISITVLWLAHLRIPGRNAQFLAAAIIGLLLATVLATLLPAVGPLPADQPSLLAGSNQIDDIFEVRAGRAMLRSVAELQGIIAFPSYHTFLALLITWAHRGLRSFWVFALWNGMMLFGIPSIGNHCVVDMIGGAAVAVAAIWLGARLVGSVKPDTKSVAGVDAILG